MSDVITARAQSIKSTLPPQIEGVKPPEGEVGGGGVAAEEEEVEEEAWG